MTQQRILLINQFFSPDGAPTAKYLGDLADALTDAGVGVDVLCSAGGYRADGAGAPTNQRAFRVAPLTRSRRAIPRALESLWFSLRVLAHILTSRDRGPVVCMTSPPLVGVPAAIGAALRRRPLISWIMDLYPDVLDATAGRRGIPWPLRRLLATFGRLQFIGRAIVVAIGPDMRDRCRSYTSRPIVMVPLWPLDAHDAASQPSLVPAPRLRLCYSGNLGLGHRWLDFAQAALMRVGRVELTFACSGGRRRALERWLTDHPDAPVRVTQLAPAAELERHLASFDAHLISMERGWDGCMVPSKLQGLFGRGLPVVAVAPRTSSLFCWIEASGGGWAVAPGDLDGLLAAFDHATDALERRRRAASARRFAERFFDRRRNLDRLVAIMLSRLHDDRKGRATALDALSTVKNV